MVRLLVAFVPVAAVLTLTPGAATALVVRSTVRGGRRHALLTTAGNSVGVFIWGVLAAVGLAAVVATSATAFSVVKIVGAVVLVALGVQALRGRGGDGPLDGMAPRRRELTPRAAFRDGVLTSMANPKLAAFFVALFPQFVPHGQAVLPAALLMAALIVTIDFVWFSTLAFLITRARRAFVDGPWMRRAERLTGVVLVGLGVRLALERR
jgi:threonine/homoserine/homoserine lactone efflux protein